MESKERKDAEYNKGSQIEWESSMISPETENGTDRLGTNRKWREFVKETKLENADIYEIEKEAESATNMTNWQ